MNVLDGFYPAAGKAFVRHIRTEERYANSSIIIPEPVRDKVARTQMIVVSVGDYERCPDPDECNRPHYKGVFHQHRLMEGSWVLAKNRSWLATPDPDIFVVNQSDILGTFIERT